MRTVLILNPASGASMMAAHQGTPEEHKDSIEAALRAAGLEPETWYTTPEEHGYALAQKAAQEGADLVIAAGGDGTLHAVASGLIGTESTLGIIATGTMNNVARSLDIPEDIEGACEIIARGETCPIDVGKINDRVFLEVAGIGLEAAIFPAAEEFKSPGWISTLSGTLKGLTTLLTFQPTRFRASFDGSKLRPFKAIQVSICNTPYYGAHLRFAPNAVMNDGLLDVLIYRNFSKLEYIRHALTISQGKRVLEPKIRQRKIKTLTIYADQPVEIHADGEVQGYTPATVVIEPGVLRVRVPKHIATGPNTVQPAIKRTKYYRKAREHKMLVTDDPGDARAQPGNDLQHKTSDERDTAWPATPANQ